MREDLPRTAIKKNDFRHVMMMQIETQSLGVDDQSTIGQIGTGVVFMTSDVQAS
jgi:hypothetical protein